jgi:hypothetical protein
VRALTWVRGYAAQMVIGTARSQDCIACGRAPRARGLLCNECAQSLGSVDDLCPEQITAALKELPDRARAQHAALLVDAFGVAHVVGVGNESATIGRSRTSDLCIAVKTVSIAHALLEHREKSGAWFIADAQSENGTFVNEEPVTRRFPLEPLDRISFGRGVSFVFVPVGDADTDGAADVERVAEALRSQHREPSMDTRRDLRFDDGRPLKVRAVTEGGAVAMWGASKVQLSELEYELLFVLEKRRRDELALDAAVRGFVPASHLLDVLSFKSEAPTHANLRGLVRKVRIKLAEGDPSLDVIESKKGLGYRMARALDLE